MGYVGIRFSVRWCGVSGSEEGGMQKREVSDVFVKLSD